jgi:NADH-quinone oxidoreductase subunit N
LAYSSITHVGYALLTIISKESNSQSNLLFYLFAYGFSVIALITISILINDKEDKLDGFKGLAKRNPFLGFVSILALLSLAGVPPLVGFFGKYLVFAGAITDFPVLVVIAIINSGIGIYYYLKTIMTIISKDDVSSDKLEVSSIQYLVLALCTIGLLVGGMLISHI